jgi:hypothetical protein
MWSAIPIVGWFLGLMFAVFSAVPFWFLWTYCGLGQRYFYFLPAVYIDMGFWNIVGLFLVISILRSRLMPDFSTTVNSAKKD